MEWFIGVIWVVLAGLHAQSLVELELYHKAHKVPAEERRYSGGLLFPNAVMYTLLKYYEP